MVKSWMVSARATALLLLLFAAGSSTFGTSSIDVVSKPYTNTAHVFGDSSGIELSADGHWALFSSTGNGLATNDNNGLHVDLFLKDLQTGNTTLVSRNLTGGSGTGDSLPSGISADGRFSVFASDADDLVAGDENQSSDVFLYDRQNGQLILLSRTADRFANAESGNATITRNGRFVLFESNAENLSPLDKNAATDLFLFDREANQLQLVTLNSNNTASASIPVGASYIGALSGAMDEQGRYIAFISAATNLVLPRVPAGSGDQLYVRDMLSGTNRWISQTTLQKGGQNVSSPILSTNGTVLAFLSSSLLPSPAPKNSQWLHIYSLTSNTLSEVPAPPLVSINSSTIDEFSLSADGKFIAYTLNGQIYRYDLEAGTTKTISKDANGLPGSSPSSYPLLSDDGAITIFSSAATNLAPFAPGPSTQLYSYDARTDKLTFLTPNATKTAGANNDAIFPSLSGDGSEVAFTSFASDFVADDDKYANDLFLALTSGAEPVHLVSVPLPTSTSTTAAGPSDLTANAISLDGRFVAFSSGASDVVQNDDNAMSDVFLRDLNTGITHLVSISADGVHPIAAASTFLGMSADGHRIAFSSTNSANPGISRSVYVYDIKSGTNFIGSLLPSGEVAAANEGNLSENGRYLAFRATGVNSGLYVRDLETAQTRLAINSSTVAAFLGISPGGNYVRYFPNTGTLRLIDWLNGRSIDLSGRGTFTAPMPADDSAVLIYLAGLPLGGDNLYLYSLTQNKSNLIATNASFATISGDGSTIAYQQRVDGTQMQLFTHDVKSATSREVVFPQGDPNFRLRSTPVLSDNGRYFAFVSTSPLVGGTKGNIFGNVFVYDRALTNLMLLSHQPNGAYPEFGSGEPSLSADGHTIVFQSNDPGLVENDRNMSADVFVAYQDIPDSDHDGLDDGWEMANFGTLAANPQDDSDSDGATNLQEFQNGTDPLAPGSSLNLQASIQADGKLSLEWNAVRGKIYQLQIRSDLSTASWQNVADPVTTITDLITVEGLPTSDGSAFYRLTTVH